MRFLEVPVGKGGMKFDKDEGGAEMGGQGSAGRWMFWMR